MNESLYRVDGRWAADSPTSASESDLMERIGIVGQSARSFARSVSRANDSNRMSTSAVVNYTCCWTREPCALHRSRACAPPTSPLGIRAAQSPPISIDSMSAHIRMCSVYVVTFDLHLMHVVCRAMRVSVMSLKPASARYHNTNV